MLHYFVVVCSHELFYFVVLYHTTIVLTLEFSIRVTNFVFPIVQCKMLCIRFHHLILLIVIFSINEPTEKASMQEVNREHIRSKEFLRKVQGILFNNWSMRTLHVYFSLCSSLVEYMSTPFAMYCLLWLRYKYNFLVGIYVLMLKIFTLPFDVCY